MTLRKLVSAHLPTQSVWTCWYCSSAYSGLWLLSGPSPLAALLSAAWTAVRVLGGSCCTLGTLATWTLHTLLHSAFWLLCSQQGREGACRPESGAVSLSKDQCGSHYRYLPFPSFSTFYFFPLAVQPPWTMERVTVAAVWRQQESFSLSFLSGLTSF